MKKNLQTILLIAATCGMCLVVMWASARVDAQTTGKEPTVAELKHRIAELEKANGQLRVQLGQLVAQQAQSEIAQADAKLAALDKETAEAAKPAKGATGSTAPKEAAKAVPNPPKGQ